MTEERGESVLCAHVYEDESEQCPALAEPGSRFCEEHAADTEDDAA